jgi:cell pole-organizing protein PopZ
MTQAAKVQEPSMEEILASIRRIIADDEAKPASGADKPVAAAPPPAPAKPEKPAAAAASAPAAKPVTNDIPPSKPTPAPPAPPPTPPAASNSQDDIDALLNGLDETTTEQEVRPPQPDGEVLELTDDMAVEAAPPPAQASFQKVDPEDDLEFAEAVASKSMPPAPAYDLPPAFEAAGAPRQAPILSATTMAAVDSAFSTLAHTVLSNNARTLEDLVKEMLRPMLKSWLDDNLPGLVERIVKAEIERVSRGR